MTEKKRKRYPADRQKLHALLEKREQELIELQEEVEELRRLAASGYCEVVLTAISLPSYGKDTGTGLAELVEHAAAGLLGDEEDVHIGQDGLDRLAGLVLASRDDHGT